MAAHQYVYVMKGLTKAYTGGRPVVEDIWLSFYPGAKIGVLGLNGSGKSSLLRIMAGEDTEYQGEAWAADGLKIGFLPQEPQLDPDKDVLGNVMEGVAETQALLDRFNEVSMRFGEDLTPEEMDALIAEQAELQDQIEAADAWELETCRAVSAAGWRCAGCYCRTRTCCCSTSRPTISTPNRSPGSSASSPNSLARWWR
jgi:ATPase subunit of ABC transporter with duplicated ATPase domains